VSGQQGVPTGRLAITAPALFGARFVTPIVTEYLERFPGVNASCWFLDRVVNMMDEGWTSRYASGASRFVNEPSAWAGAARHRGYRYLKGAPPLNASADLLQHSIVAASGVAPTPEWRLMQDSEAVSIKLQPRVLTTSNDSAIQACLHFGLTRLLSCKWPT
jgi:DNA-binding transcriptional LysR family regulator